MDDIRITRLEGLLREDVSEIHSKLDKVLEVQVEMQKDIAYHIYRTDINEKNIEKISAAIQPIQQHVALVQSWGNVLIYLLGIAVTILVTYMSMK